MGRKGKNLKRLVRQEEQHRRVNGMAQDKEKGRRSGRAGWRARVSGRIECRACQGAEQDGGHSYRTEQNGGQAKGQSMAECMTRVQNMVKGTG